MPLIELDKPIYIAQHDDDGLGGPVFRNLLKEVSLSVCSKSQIENDVIADTQSTAILKNPLADSRIPRSLDCDLICVMRSHEQANR